MAVTVINVTKGDTTPFTITVDWHTLSASNGLNPYHTGAGKLTFEGKLSISDPDTAAFVGGPAPLFTKTLASGISVTADGNNTNTNGVVAVTLSAADWASLLYDVPVSIFCSLKGFDGTNEFTIQKDVILAVSSQATSKVM